VIEVRFSKGGHLVYSDLASFLTVIVLCVGTVSAILGLSAWKKQMKGKTEYELARRLLHGLYNIRESIAEVRYPYIASDEYIKSLQDQFDKQNIDPQNPKFEGMKKEAIYKSRWPKLLNVYKDYMVDVLEAEAIWGKDARQVLEKINLSINTLQTAYLTIIEDAYNQGRSLGDSLPDFMKIISSWSDYTNQVKFKLDLDSVITEIENYLRNYLNA
jgi:hypothetical protein